ncbi:MAG: hypothetical protein DI535_11470 [Citrobacter freundii]|nr:MAG: hypothetical protein DI535_11470 [Citrobacter freundii]
MKPALKYNNSIFFFASVFFLLILGVAIYTEKYYLLAIPFAVLIFLSGWRSLSFAFGLLIASIPFSTEFQFSETLGTDLPDEMLMLLVSVLSLLYAAQNGKSLIRLFSHPLLLCLLSLLCWSVIAALFSAHPLLSIKYLLAKGWYIGAFVIGALLVWKNKDTLKTTGIILAVSMLVVSLVIFARHASESFSFASVSDVVQPFFRNHVNYSSLLVCTLPVWFACWKLSSPINIKRWIICALIISVVALFVTYARGAWLALVVGIIVYHLIKRRIVIGVLLITIVLITITLTWLIHNDKYLDFAPDQRTTIFHEDLREHLVATYELTDMSAAERFYRWIAGVRMTADQPIVGFGPGTFYETYKPYTVPAYRTWVSDNPERSTVHNYFLLTAAEQGIPALILFGILITGVMYYAQHIFHRVTDLFYKTAGIITGVIFSMILMLNFLSDLVETDKIGSLFFLCIAALAAIDVQVSKIEKAEPVN